MNQWGGGLYSCLITILNLAVGPKLRQKPTLRFLQVAETSVSANYGLGHFRSITSCHLQWRLTFDNPPGNLASPPRTCCWSATSPLGAGCGRTWVRSPAAVQRDSTLRLLLLAAPRSSIRLGVTRYFHVSGKKDHCRKSPLPEQRSFGTIAVLFVHINWATEEKKICPNIARMPKFSIWSFHIRNVCWLERLPGKTNGTRGNRPEFIINYEPQEGFSYSAWMKLNVIKVIWEFVLLHTSFKLSLASVLIPVRLLESVHLRVVVRFTKLGTINKRLHLIHPSNFRWKVKSCHVRVFKVMPNFTSRKLAGEESCSVNCVPVDGRVQADKRERSFTVQVCYVMHINENACAQYIYSVRNTDIALVEATTKRCCWWQIWGIFALWGT